MKAALSCDRGATRLETLVGYTLLVGAVLGIFGVGAMTLGSVFGETHHATAVDGKPFTHESEQAEQVSVNVAAAATVVESVGSADPVGGEADSCANLPGRQSRGFDCSMPLFVDALDVAASHAKGHYECADQANYQLVGGQGESLHKQCILKSATR